MILSCSIRDKASNRSRCQRVSPRRVAQANRTGTETEQDPGSAHILWSPGNRNQAWTFLGFNIRQLSNRQDPDAPRDNQVEDYSAIKTHIKPSKNSNTKTRRETSRNCAQVTEGVDQESIDSRFSAPKIVGWCNYFAIYACAQRPSGNSIKRALCLMLLAWATSPASSQRDNVG